MDPVELSDARLLLRLPVLADVDAVMAACQDPELQRWIPVPVPYERMHAEQWIEETPRSWSEDHELRWVIVDKAAAADSAGPVGHDAPGEAVGAIGLHARDASMREVGYWLAPHMRGRGVMTAAVQLVCRWGFHELGLGRIEWWANAGNHASRRVAEKAGFTMEGTVRARLLHRGVRVDGWGAGLLPGDLPDEPR